MPQRRENALATQHHFHYATHRRYVLTVLSRRCPWLDPADGEAILHDAYTVLLEKQLGGLDVRSMRPPQVRAYLTQTALHKAMDEGKRAARRRSLPLDASQAGLDLPEDRPGPDEIVARSIDAALVREIIAELPYRQQVVVRLRFDFERSPEQIQHELGVTERVYRREFERALRHIAGRYELVRDGRFCQHRQSLLLAYVAGIAGPSRSMQARRHLRTCAPCARWAAQQRFTAAATGGDPLRRLVPSPRGQAPASIRGADRVARRPPPGERAGGHSDRSP